VFVLADVTMDGPTRLLEATTGTVTVTAVSPDVGTALAIEVDGATFQEVSADDFSPVPGSDCASPLARAALAGTLDQLQP
jgi:hypothetical protein